MRDEVRKEKRGEKFLGPTLVLFVCFMLKLCVLVDEEGMRRFEMSL